MLNKKKTNDVRYNKNKFELTMSSIKSGRAQFNRKDKRKNPYEKKPRLVCRKSQVSRTTSETDIFLKLVIDGKGKNIIKTGIAFLDHMLTLMEITIIMKLEHILMWLMVLMQLH